MSELGDDSPHELLGVLGGMGPAATADFYQKLVSSTPSLNDAEHLPVVIWGDPRTPDRSDAITGMGEDPTPWLRRGMRMLRDAGATAIVVPCVTSHHFVRELAAELGVQLLDMVEETARHVAATGSETPGILATTGTVRTQLFQHALDVHGVKSLVPNDDQQERVTAAIRLVKAGRAPEARPILLGAVESLKHRGADSIIMGCTEVPLGLEGASADVALINPVQIVIDRIVADFLARQK